MHIDKRSSLLNTSTFVALSSNKGLQNWLDTKSGKEALAEFSKCFGHGKNVKVITPQGDMYELDTREF